MKKNTRFAFNAYLQQLARLNGVAVEELSSKFTVEPSVQQTLEDQIQQSAAFLTLINVTPVTEQSGQLLGLGVGSTIAGTTDTTAKEREPVDPTLMVDVEYKCEQTNFDTVLTYAKLDLWAKFQDFQVRIRDAIVKRQALDRIMIGFNGVKRAKTSNRSENPLLQDVNKGWLQKIREDAPDHVMGSTTTGGETTPGAVKVGKRSRAITWWGRMKTCWYLIAPMLIGVMPNGQRKCSGNACNAALRHSRYNWRKGGQISTRKCQ